MSGTSSLAKGIHNSSPASYLTVRDGGSESDSDDNDMPDSGEPPSAGQIDQRNDALREEFEDGMTAIATMRRHPSVAVLLLSWEKRGDDYLDTEDEVRRLKEIFEDTYHFSVEVRLLHTSENEFVQHQLADYLTQFVRRHDKPNSKTLLIVYYAGHGVKHLTKRDLKLAGGNPKPKGSFQKDFGRILWSEAEQQLHRAAADKLLIFDCCYAGQLTLEDFTPAAVRATTSDNIFDFIGATPHNKTAIGPGPRSFTTALIWALGQLANEKAGFTTLQLHRRIQSAPGFSELENQSPVLGERGKKPSMSKLQIAPLPVGQDATDEGSSPFGDTREAPVQYYLNLQFLYSRYPTRKILKHLTRSLCSHAKDAPALKTVLWRDLTDKDGKLDLHDVVQHVVSKVRRNRRLSMKRAVRPQSINPVEEQDQLLQDTQHGSNSYVIVKDPQSSDPVEPVIADIKTSGEGLQSDLGSTD